MHQDAPHRTVQRLLLAKGLVRRLVTAVIVSLAMPAVASAHSFAIYVSTPLTPPATFEWLRPIAAAAIAVSVFIAMWLVARSSWIEGFFVAISATVLFSLTFLFIGYYAAGTNTRPPPGLGPPSSIYWHWRDGELGFLFTTWNIIGAGTLGISTFLVGRLWRGDRRRRAAVALIIPVVTHAALLLPFLQSGAIAHGWAGGYVMNAGHDQLHDVNRACFLYAADHDGLFPVAKNLNELMPQIQSYLKRKRSLYGNPITVHPAAWAFEKQPKPYVWNAGASGQPAPELPIENASELPVQCPYIGERALPLYDLEESH